MTDLSQWQVAAALLAAMISSASAVAQRRVPDAATASVSPRQRISINSGWRFHLGDPEGAAGKLLYDIRPERKLGD